MDQTFSRWQPIALSLMRFITGLVLFQYGVAKLLKIPAVSPFAKVHLMSLFGAAGAIELTLGGLLLLGLFTRPVAFILAGEMAFALFHRTFPEELLPGCQWRSLAIALCFTCLFLATAGGGPISVDALIGRKG